MQLQSVYYGDCVKHLEPWRALNFELLSSARSLADLIYLDPPWNGNANYNILRDKGDNAEHGHTAQETAFTDIWEWSADANDRVQMLCNSDFHPYGPQSPLLRVRRAMQGLNLAIGESGMLDYLAYMAERLALMSRLFSAREN